MKLDVYKNAWKIYKNSFGKLFTFTISLIVVDIAAFVALSLLMGFDFGISTILIFFFGLLPLFFSYQLVIAKVSSGREISYNEMYSTYKLYFQTQNRGIYSIILNLLLSGIVASVMLFLSLVLYDFIYPDVLENAVNTITNNGSMMYYNDLINVVLNLNNYIYFLICFMSLAFLFFFKRVRKNFMLPYFNLIVGVPVMISHQLNKRIYMNEKKYIRETSMFGNLMFDIAFIVGFIVTGIITNIFAGENLYIEILFTICLAGGLLLSSFLVPPLMIVQCFMADALHNQYLVLVKEQMVKVTKNIEADESVDEEKKLAIKKFLDAFQNQIQQDKEDLQKELGKEEKKSENEEEKNKDSDDESKDDSSNDETK